MENIANPLSRICFRRVPRIVHTSFLAAIRYPQSEPNCCESRTMPHVVEKAQITRKLALLRNTVSPEANFAPVQCFCREGETQGWELVEQISTISA